MGDQACMYMYKYMCTSVYSTYILKVLEKIKTCLHSVFFHIMDVSMRTHSNVLMHASADARMMNEYIHVH